MKKNGKQVKIALIALVLGLSAVAAGFSQTPRLEDLENKVKDFSDDLAKSLPFNSTLGLNWSDAHVGQFLGVPPHFGAGVSGGFTTMRFGAFDKLLGQFGLDVPLNMGQFPIPGYTVEGRVGGFILPFDVGLKFGILPIKLENDLKMDYTLIGGDFRYALIEGNVVLPKVSVGVGFNYLAGGIEQSLGQGRSFAYTDVNGASQTLSLSSPTVGLVWETTTLDFKAQISKSFLIVTPYLGVGASHAWSKAGYKVNATLSDSGGNLTAIKKLYGLSDIDAGGFSSIRDVTGWSFRTFGGLSLNVAVLRFDLTGMYNFMDGNFGGSLGIRFQL